MVDLEPRDVEWRGRGHAEREAGFRVRPRRDSEPRKAEPQHPWLRRERRRRDRQQDERKPGPGTHGRRGIKHANSGLSTDALFDVIVEGDMWSAIVAVVAFLVASPLAAQTPPGGSPVFH